MIAASAATHIPPLHHLIALETRTIRTMSALDRESEALAALETELEAFLDQYYAKVGALFEELARLEQDLGHIQGFFPPRSSDIMIKPIKSPQNPAKNELKALYRELVKSHHPDVSSHNNGEWMQAINDAYAQANMAELVRLQWSAPTSDLVSAEQQIEKLEQQCEDLQHALIQVQQRQLHLKQSSAYALMCKALQLRLCGQDFIGQMKAHVLGLISQKKREILIARCLKAIPMGGGDYLAAGA